MTSELLTTLAQLAKRHEELGMLLSDPQALADQQQYTNLTREFAETERPAAGFTQMCKLQQEIEDAKQMLTEVQQDGAMRTMVQEELQQLQGDMASLHNEMTILLLPIDPNDQRHVYLEIRAGTGGDEAAIFAGDLYKMYFRYCELRQWQMEIVSANEGQHGGFREIITHITGKHVYASLKFESGAHRVQRVPLTETQGRIHTSACTVAVMPEPDPTKEVSIAREELRIDTFRSSGAGGQHVNTTDSAIRITHIPTGTVVECQDERSQHKNKARAMSLLQARITNQQEQQQRQLEAQTRKSLVGSGDRSERIRTYNFPQSRVTDHRINLTLYNLVEVMQGELEPLIDGLIQANIAEQTAQVLDASSAENNMVSTQEK